MTPEPYPSMLDQADGYEIAAEKAKRRGDYLHEKFLRLEASALRDQVVAAKSRAITLGRATCDTPEYRAVHPAVGTE